MTTTSKTWDRAIPFTRINSPSETPPPQVKGRLDGDGHARGTRRPSDFHANNLLDSVVTSELLRLTPSWTQTLDDPEHELQGILVRSFQTWTDAPPFQWHRFYDWNFHVIPEANYDWLRGVGNGAGGDDKPFDFDPGFFSRKRRSVRTVPGPVMECEWDTGAIGTFRPGPMFHADWAWPLTHQRIWMVGNSIYDGGHETHGTNLCRSELHPVKAMATARWEAFAFKENNEGKEDGKIHTPAIQFMFFASKFGGWFDHKDIKPKGGKLYEFIVDLPLAPIAKGPHPIGSTPDVAVNTIMLRKLELLKHFDKKRFSNAKGSAADADPIVELIPLADGADPTKRQAKITIPANALTGDFYGVLVSLGWRDPTGEQAGRVKKVTVEFKNLHKGQIDHDTFKEEWRFKAAVNGRWFQWEFNGVSNGSNHDLSKDQTFSPTKVVMFLDEDDFVQFSSHGAELDLVDDVYQRLDAGRTVTITPDGVEEEATGHTSQPQPQLAGVGATPGPVKWFGQIEVKPLLNNQAYPVQRAIARSARDLMITTLNDQNEPLGLMDAFVNQPAHEKKNNPFFIKGHAGKPATEFELTGYETYEEGDSAELLERAHDNPSNANDPDFIDYKLKVSVLVEDQKP
jgi:hypothetical protein